MTNYDDVTLERMLADLEYGTPARLAIADKLLFQLKTDVKTDSNIVPLKQ